MNRETFTYWKKSLLHSILELVVHFANDVNIPFLPTVLEQSMMLIQALMAPPAAPHVSGRVIQASVWIPRSTHWLCWLLKFNAYWLYKCMNVYKHVCTKKNYCVI